MDLGMTLPQDGRLDIGRLSRVFRDCSSSYKMFWFLAILQELEGHGKQGCEQDVEIPFSNLVRNMLDKAYRPFCVHHISTRKQDHLHSYIRRIIDSRKPSGIRKFVQSRMRRIGESFSLEQELADGGNFILMERNGHLRKYSFSVLDEDMERDEFAKVCNVFKGNVAKFFLSPFEDVPNELKPYTYPRGKEKIRVPAAWAGYLFRNNSILAEWCRWHLTRHLQRCNPNVPNLIEKVSFKVPRGNLNAARKLWQELIRRHSGKNPICCPYTARRLDDDFHVDHFIPHSYVMHDMLWNLIPAAPIANESKNDRLPNLQDDTLMGCFVQNQWRLANLITRDNAPQKHVDYWEDYARDLFNEPDLASLPPEERFKGSIQSLIKNLHSSASHNGFSTFNHKRARS